MTPANLIATLSETTDRDYYENLDPFFHYMTLDALKNAQISEFRLREKGSDRVNDHRLLEILKRSDSLRSEHLKSLGRVFRYFSAETLLLIILSGGPFGPFARLSSNLKFNELNQVFSKISDRVVPDAFSLNMDGRALTFDEWVSYQSFGVVNAFKNREHKEVVGLIVEEANLAKERGAINAFKHAKPFSFGDGIEMTLTNNETQEQASNIKLRGINWVEWKEGKEAGSTSVSFYTEEVKPDEDMQRLFAVGLLIDAIRTARLAKLDRAEKVNVALPADLKNGLEVRRQHLTINLVPVEE